MKAPNNFLKYILLSITFIFIITSNASAGLFNTGPQCNDIVSRDGGGYINVLTFNILFFSRLATVETRLEPLVDFLVSQEIPVDIIFLQEVVGGSLALSDFTNSAKILQEKLSDRGLEYNLKTAFEVGLPGVFYTGNAILSRCEIKYSIVKRLSRESEIEIRGRIIKLPRNIQMARIKIPGFGQFNAYNTHLCSGCTANERGDQLSELFNFMETVENIIPGANPIILAGDFNIDRLQNASEDYLYQWIISEGFVDAYAESSGEPLNDLCDDEDIHCTYGVSAFDLPSGGDFGRIDYIFEHGFGSASYGEVFFNPVVDSNEPHDLVSDHSAVLVRIPLYP
jgi:maltose 6'-phosphate phosphatase